MNSIEVIKIKSFLGHRDGIYSISDDLNESVFYSAGAEGQVVQWNLADMNEGRLIAKLSNSIYSMITLKDTGNLVIGQNYSGIHLLDLVNKKEKGSLQLTDAAIFDIKRKDDFFYLLPPGKVILK